MEARVASLPGGAAYTVYLNNQLIGSDTVEATGGWQTFETHDLGNATANDGVNVLRVEVSRGLFNLNWLRFVPVATAEQDNGGVIDSHIVQQANGDVRFSLITSSKMEDARVFVKVNGIQVYAGLTMASQNGDGSYTYHYTRAAQYFHSGDVIEVRFFHFDPLTGQQVFSPGPYLPPDFNWYQPTTYSGS